jgi:hypothetical protein
MKKFLKVFGFALLVVVLAFAFAGCDKSGSIQKAFEKEGYTVTTVKAEDSDELKALLSEDQQKDVSGYAVLSCSKGIVPIATVIKFPSKSDLKEALGDDEYEEAVDNGYVNGNCYIITLVPGAVTIFKNA